jgi:hypothetical protein
MVKPEFAVLVGICTHLGCIPTYEPNRKQLAPGWLGGWFCPCHGSKYDLAGRGSTLSVCFRQNDPDWRKSRRSEARAGLGDSALTAAPIPSIGLYSFLFSSAFPAKIRAIKDLPGDDCAFVAGRFASHRRKGEL